MRNAVKTTGNRPIPSVACFAALALAPLAILSACAPAADQEKDEAKVPVVTRTDPQSQGDWGPCARILTHEKWSGTVRYAHSRDVSAAGRFDLGYDMNIALGAQLAERTRRQHRGADYLVQYYSPLPEGTAKMDYTLHSHDNLGLKRKVTFASNSRMQRQEADMTEEGSSLSLTLNAHDCTYQFYLQGQVFGSGEIWDREDGTQPYSGPMWILSVNGEGTLVPGAPIRGSAPFPLLSRSRIENNQIEKSRWVSDLDLVARALGEDQLGTIVVEWDFRPEH